ncbi:hypothetical protein CDAR_283461 [Caerostris darwini]|uniref:Uncharacterized protein n=1 Tax=Caerostris darwini TaxID=1538125 RepID=A0AAV4SK58_9ARAC|nr:hypothetical protein CDAR_283461 [Caerostris darwini]
MLQCTVDSVPCYRHQIIETFSIKQIFNRRNGLQTPAGMQEKIVTAFTRRKTPTDLQSKQGLLTQLNAASTPPRKHIILQRNATKDTIRRHSLLPKQDLHRRNGLLDPSAVATKILTASLKARHLQERHSSSKTTGPSGRNGLSDPSVEVKETR